MKRLKFLLNLWDGIWSIPLSFMMFMAFGNIAQMLWGTPEGGGPGIYSPEFFQAALLASVELIFFNSVVWAGFYFTFRGIFRYYVGDKEKNQSKSDFKNLSGWQRIGLLVFLYCFYLQVLVFLYSRHV